MQINMLRKALWVFLKPLIHLITNLLNPEVGEEWLTELKKFLRKEECWVGKVAGSTAQILKFTGNFNPAFVGKDWKVLTDTDNGNSVDLLRVVFATCLKESETSTSGEERLIRLKAVRRVSLGGQAFKVCWENRTSLPESWKRNDNGDTRYIFFDGLVLLGPHRSRYTLCLFWDGGRWDWIYRWLGNDRFANRPSAVLAN